LLIPSYDAYKDDVQARISPHSLGSVLVT